MRLSFQLIILHPIQIVHLSLGTACSIISKGNNSSNFKESAIFRLNGFGVFLFPANTDNNIFQMVLIFCFTVIELPWEVRG